MTTPTLSGLLPGLAAVGSVAAGAPWWIAVPLTLHAFPALAPGIATLITTCSDARASAMWRRREDTFLEDPDRYRAGLEHIALVRQTAPPPPPPPAAQAQQPANPPATPP
ncbi:hypothetical protein AB0E04_43955 [Streptomyces sp. NPDC048251]|uniref:hypothetical protein n=1 Tax=Streptomyces sp. NPDC048251 TaxID=3154501 RepID=UPI00343C5EA9